MWAVSNDPMQGGRSLYDCCLHPIVALPICEMRILDLQLSFFGVESTIGNIVWNMQVQQNFSYSLDKSPETFMMVLNALHIADACIEARWYLRDWEGKLSNHRKQASRAATCLIQNAYPSR